MRLRSLSHRQAGFSLVELGVVLVIVGIIGIFAWRWVNATREPLQRPAILSQLAQAQAAVEGFALAYHRMPCAAATPNGLEDCTNTSAQAVHLPWRSLGLDSSFSVLHYGVNRGGAMDLAVLPAAQASPDLNVQFSPEVPTLAVDTDPNVNAAAATLSAAIAAAQQRRSQINGLDWCRTLRHLAGQGAGPGVLEAGNLSTSIAVAFVIVHPGVNSVFEGNNVVGGAGGWRFDFPTRAQTDSFDDVAIAVGAADLSARLGCVARLGGMQAAAQGAYTAYDNARLAQEYWSLRLFDIEQAESALEGAETGVAMAAMNLALATASAALAVASASNTELLTVFGVALSIANVAAATAEVVLAAEDLEAAKEALQASKDKELAVRVYVIELYTAFAQALNTAVALDQKGLNP